MQPLTSAYLIINNLNPVLEDFIGCPSALMIIGIYKKDFPNLKDIYDKIALSGNNIIFCDLDNNSLILTHNKEMNKTNKIPINRVKELIDNLINYSNIFDPKLNVI